MSRQEWGKGGGRQLVVNRGMPFWPIIKFIYVMERMEKPVELDIHNAKHGILINLDSRAFLI
jgi:hypothetical protein